MLPVRIWCLIVAIAVVALLQFAGAAPSHAELTLCNATPIKIWSAVGYRQNDQWHAEGWWKLWPGECVTPISGALKNRYYYARAESVDRVKVWNESEHGSSEFCVSSDGFTLADKPCHGGDRRKFSTIDTGEDKSYRQRFTCPDCERWFVSFDAGRKQVRGYVAHKETIGGITVHGDVVTTLKLSLQDGAIRINMSARADLSDFQQKSAKIAEALLSRKEECGDRVYVRDVRLGAASNNAELYVRAQYQKWECPSMDVPQVKCEDTWIEIGGFKTKGAPQCTTYIETTRLAKTRLIEQTGSSTFLIRPRVHNGKSVDAEVEVTDARLRGFAQFLVKLFKVDLKGVVQGHVDRMMARQDLSLTVPDELRPYVRIQSVRFSNEDGHLWLVAEGSFSVDPGQVQSLCKRFFGSSRC